MVKKKRSMLLVLMNCLFLGIPSGGSAAGKPRIKILATGGTIAGSADSDTATTGYRAGELGVDALMDAVPGIREIADVSGEQIASLDSKDMTDAVWLKLSRRVNELLARADVDGIVITHGTDTLEETAYFLNLTVQSRKPVVLTGAMRPATAISADGPMNLLDAVRLAASPSAGDRGVLVCLNGQIDGARDVTKTHTTALDAFQSPGFGALGSMHDGQPAFYGRTERRHAGHTEFDVSALQELPYVKVIYGHADDDALFAEAAVQAGARGIVYAGTGNGSIHKAAETALARAAEAGIIVVRSTRVGGGAVIPAEASYIKEGFLEGDSLNPQKCRILLQLALTKTDDRSRIQQMFHEY